MLEQKPWLRFYHEDVKEWADIPEISLPQLLDQAAQKYGDWTSLTFFGKSWTFLQVHAIVEKLAAALYELGLKKGERLAIMLPNSPHYVFSLFATFRVGGIAVQVNPMYVEREIEHVLNDSGATTMVVLDAFYSRVKNVQSRTSLKKCIVVSFNPADLSLEDGDVLFDTFVQAGSVPCPACEINPREDIAVLQYTGGTTGVSKGVMLTHHNLISNLEQTYDFMYKTVERPDNAKIINVLPMFHIYGLTCCTFMGFRAGLHQVILPRFDVNEVLSIIKQEKPFQFAGVPTMFAAFNSHPELESFGLDTIFHFTSGGAPLPVELLHSFEKRVRGVLLEGYGLSEASPVTHFNAPFANRKPGSIGIPLPSTEVKIVDVATGTQEVQVGEIGELIVKGPQVMKGYWRRPEETAAVLRDGWLYTGDLATRDEDGYFYIVDRKKDMIISSGYNVYPREVEEVLYLLSEVQEAIVVGIPDEYRGEAVKAFIALKPGASINEEEVLTHCRKHLAAYKVPRFVEFRTQLPKSAVGKLLRRELRDAEKKAVQPKAETGNS